MTLSWPFARGQGFLLVVAALALLLVSLGVAGLWVDGLAFGLALLAAAFLIRLELDPAAVSPWTPVAAAAILLAAELGYWSLEGSAGGADEGRSIRRLLQVLLLVGAAGIVCELVLDLSAALPLSGGWLLLLGVAAATATPVVLLRLARRA